MIESTREMILVALLALSVTGTVYGDSVNNTTSYTEVEWISYSLTGRIVNGTKAASRQFPYQVSLQRSYNSRHFCGGSLIDEYYVVTAAHCMFLEGRQILPWTVMVVAGEIQLDAQTSTGQRRGVEKIYVHSQFNATTLQNDIALLYLKVPFELTQEITPALLTITSPTPGTVCQVSGWGYPDQNFPVVSNDLMYVDLPIVDPTLCGILLVNVTSMLPGMFCAGYMEGQRDACQGDSGGGMICNGYLTGVVSGGHGCALPETPGVYSSLLFFEEWILKTMNSQGLVGRNSSNAGSEKTFASALLLFILSAKLAYL
ncbi:trypsin-3 [Lasioglossum baleicum]|uniref:trypsin-3 n=1 Tax=Lasioglossum baleicum TaxID=434251 RepID=UPI003FCCBF17